jgi:hypothetical protein
MEEIEIYQRENGDMLGDMPGWLIYTGSYIVYGLILLLITGCAVIRFPDIVERPVRIDRTGSVEWVTAGHSGVIDRFLVEDQSHVSAHDTLAILRNSASLDDVKRFCRVLTRVECYYRTLNPDYLRNYPFDLIMGDMTPAYEQFTQAARDCLQFHELDVYPQKKAYLEKELRILDGRDDVDELTRLGVQRELFELGIEHRREQEKNRHALELAYENMVNSLRTWESRYLILCSDSGIVSLGKSWGIDRRIQEGDTICTVQSSMKGCPTGHIRVPENQMSDLAAGNPVQVSLAKYPVQKYGKLCGEVEAVSYIPNSRTYAVEVRFPEELVTTNGKPVEFEVGMAGTAEIITANKSVLERIFAPLWAL